MGLLIWLAGFSGGDCSPVCFSACPCGRPWFGWKTRAVTTAKCPPLKPTEGLNGPPAFFYPYGWDVQEKKRWGNRKGRQFPGGLLVNAGNHLRSHTLTRAVPSAQRGLTSVFGMGTGVTLAVYSPANLGVLLDFFTSSVCSNNLNQSCKNTPLSFKSAWQKTCLLQPFGARHVLLGFRTASWRRTT